VRHNQNKTKFALVGWLLVLSLTAADGAGATLRSMAHGGATFSPRSSSALKFWFDPTDLSKITKDGSNKVTAVVDESSNAFSAATVSTFEPIYTANFLNGKAVFQCSNKLLKFAQTTATVAKNSPFAWYMVLKHSSINTGNFNIIASPSEGALTGRAPFFNYDQTNGKYEFVGESGQWASWTFSFSPGTTNWHIIEILYNGQGSTTLANFTFYIDKVQRTIVSKTDSNWVDRNLICNYTQSGGSAAVAFNGYMGDDIMAWETTSRADMENFLANKWNL
jgi:hypothetical protein